MNEHDLKVLQILYSTIQIDCWVNISFNSLSIASEFSKYTLDSILNELEKERYIEQLVLENHDIFRLKITDKGVAAAQTSTIHA